MSDVEAAWVGAFVQADGCVHLRRWRAGDNRPQRGPGRTDPAQIVVSQKDVEAISTLLRVTGVGVVRYYVKPTGAIYSWTVTARNDVAALLEQIAPYCEKAQGVIS
jgi:hypothetical protein